MWSRIDQFESRYFTMPPALSTAQVQYGPFFTYETIHSSLYYQREQTAKIYTVKTK